MKKLVLLLLYFFPATILAQTSGIVMDKKSGKPIAYANIWVENQNIGTTSDEKGQFSFKECLIGKKLIVTAIGYESQQTTIDQYRPTIELIPKIYLIEEIAVHPGKHKERILEAFHKFNIHNYLASSTQPWIVAKYFKYSPDYERTPCIKSLRILAKSEVVSAIFNLRLLSANEKGEPSEDILKENLLVKTKKGKVKLPIDLTKYQILFPKNGFFVALESLLVESNGHEIVYTMEGSNKKIREIRYDPYFGTLFDDANTTFWWFRDGKWLNEGQLLKINGKSEKLAIELTLTD